MLEQLRDKWAGQDVWVVGSGSSLNFVDPHFFDGKNVVAVNFAGTVLGLTSFVTFTHYRADALKVALERPSLPVVVQRWHQGESVGDMPENVIVAENKNVKAPGDKFTPYGNANQLVMGSSGIHGAMHLAAYMGAANIILAGADCGLVDGEHRVGGYPVGDTPWKLYDQHLRLMKRWLMEMYPVRVYSLNPFVNFNLEGHTFTNA